LWYERKISDLEARLIDFDSFGKLPPNALPPCGEGMFLDWYGIPQLDLGYALEKISTIKDFNINGMGRDEIGTMIEGAMSQGSSIIDIAMNLASRIQVAPGGVTLMDIQTMELDTTEIMGSILGSVINGDLTGWYMNSYGEIRHPNWEWTYVEYEFNDWDTDSWYEYYGDDWEYYYNDWYDWYNYYGYY
jgi:hypothetical protein